MPRSTPPPCLVKMVSLAVEQRKLEKEPARQAIDFFRNKSQELVSHRTGLAFNWGEGRTLASLGQDKTIRLWHVPTRRELFTLARFDQSLRWLRFASSQTLLVGVSPDEHSTNEVLVFEAAE